MKRVLIELFLSPVPMGLVYDGRNGNGDPFFLWPDLPASLSTLLVGILSESPGRRHRLRYAVDELPLVNWILENPVHGGGLPLVRTSGCRCTFIGKFSGYTPSAKAVLDKLVVHPPDDGCLEFVYLKSCPLRIGSPYESVAVRCMATYQGSLFRPVDLATTGAPEALEQRLPLSTHWAPGRHPHPLSQLGAQ